jgi:catalase
MPADGNPKDFQPLKNNPPVEVSKALSMAATVKNSVRTRQVAFLVADGVDGTKLNNMRNALVDAGAVVKVIGPTGGSVRDAKRKEVAVDQGLHVSASVLFDAVYIPGGAGIAEVLKALPDAVHFVNEAYKHCKAIGADGEGLDFLAVTYVATTAGTMSGEPVASGSVGKKTAMKSTGNPASGNNRSNGSAPGVILNGNPDAFIKAVAMHRFWETEKDRNVPA